MSEPSLPERVKIKRVLSRVHDELIAFQDAFDAQAELLPTRAEMLHAYGTRAYALRQEVAEVLRDLEPKE